LFDVIDCLKFGLACVIGAANIAATPNDPIVAKKIAVATIVVSIILIYWYLLLSYGVSHVSYINEVQLNTSL